MVGTGIRSVGQTTIETRNLIEQARVLMYLVADPITEAWIRKLNPRAESLADSYLDGRRRIETYREIVERMLTRVREGHDVCAVFYGHPGVFVYPSHAAIRQAREEGFQAFMLPGVSAEDCLFADLGVDPGDQGCQSFEATDFVLRQRRFDPTSHLVIWQIGVLGKVAHTAAERRRQGGLEVLVDSLSPHYDDDHPVTVYEAPQYAVCEPVIHTVPLRELRDAEVSVLSTLYVPPLPARPNDPVILQRLGLRSLASPAQAEAATPVEA